MKENVSGCFFSEHSVCKLFTEPSLQCRSVHNCERKNRENRPIHEQISLSPPGFEPKTSSNPA